jgi:hypothetical protein
MATILCIVDDPRIPQIPKFVLGRYGYTALTLQVASPLDLLRSFGFIVF